MEGYHDTKKIWRLLSMVMMRGGVADVDPFLVSRNTLGNGKTANSKSPKANVKWW